MTDDQRAVSGAGQGYTLFLAAGGGGLALERVAGGPGAKGAAGRRSAVLRVKLEGRGKGSRIVGEEELPGRSNYFVGKNPEGWHTQVRTYAKVRYREVYRGVDLVYYGRQGQVEHDFEVGPGRDAGTIRLRLEGAQGMKVDEKGDLVLRVEGARFAWRRPEAYQRPARRAAPDRGALREVGQGGSRVRGRTVRSPHSPHYRSRADIFDLSGRNGWRRGLRQRC